jgi:hypothetical protein
VDVGDIMDLVDENTEKPVIFWIGLETPDFSL